MGIAVKRINQQPAGPVGMSPKIRDGQELSCQGDYHGSHLRNAIYVRLSLLLRLALSMNGGLPTEARGLGPTD